MEAVREFLISSMLRKLGFSFANLALRMKYFVVVALFLDLQSLSVVNSHVCLLRVGKGKDSLPIIAPSAMVLRNHPHVVWGQRPRSIPNEPQVATRSQRDWTWFGRMV